MKGLSIKQKTTLAIMARQAYRQLESVGAADEPFDDWRHRISQEICGVASWQRMGQGHYIPLLNGLRRMLGLPPVPDRTPRDRTEALKHQLRDRMQQWELRVGYVASIVARKFGMPERKAERNLDALLHGLDEEQLLHLTYTIERAGRRIAQREAAAHDLPAPVEVHTSAASMPPARLAAWRGDVMAEPPRKPRRRSAQKPQSFR